MQRWHEHSGIVTPVSGQTAALRAGGAPVLSESFLAGMPTARPSLGAFPVGTARSDPAARLPSMSSEEPSEGAAIRRPLGERLAETRLRVPTRGNRRLERLIERAGSDGQVLGWWHMQQVGSERLGMSDHSWVHIQIVANIALRMLRIADRSGVAGCMVSDHGMSVRDAEVVVVAGAMLHDAGMSIHRVDHEAYSLFLAEPKLRQLLEGAYEEPELTVVVSEALHCIIGHRRRGQPYTLEAGVVRVADALDMAQGRSRIPVERGEVGIHSISAAAIDDVTIDRGVDRPIRVEIKMNNSAGIFQVDDLLATKIRGTPLEGHIEVIAAVEGETEKRLLREFRI